MHAAQLQAFYSNRMQIRILYIDVHNSIMKHATGRDGAGKSKTLNSEPEAPNPRSTLLALIGGFTQGSLIRSGQDLVFWMRIFRVYGSGLRGSILLSLQQQQQQQQLLLLLLLFSLFLPVLLLQLLL